MLRALLLLCWAAGATPSSAYTLNAGVEIPAPVVSRLQALAEKYQAETGQALVITDGTRSPATQAGLMLRNLERGDNIVRTEYQQYTWRSANSRKIYGLEKRMRTVRTNHVGIGLTRKIPIRSVTTLS